MEIRMLKDASTNEPVQGAFTRFKCPKCGKSEIIRSLHAKRLAIKYKCQLCNFEGPN